MGGTNVRESILGYEYLLVVVTEESESSLQILFAMWIDAKDDTELDDVDRTALPLGDKGRLKALLILLLLMLTDESEGKR